MFLCSNILTQTPFDNLQDDLYSRSCHSMQNVGLSQKMQNQDGTQETVSKLKKINRQLYLRTKSF